MNNNISKTVFFFFIILTILATLSGCGKQEPSNTENPSIDIHGLHPQNGERYTVPQLNAFGSTEGITAERNIIIEQTDWDWTGRVRDIWTLSNNTDRETKVKIAYAFSGENRFVVNGEDTETIQVCGSSSGVYGIPLETYRNLLADRTFLVDAITPPPSLNEPATMYIFEDIAGNIDSSDSETQAYEVEYEYDQQTTKVYLALTDNTVFNEENEDKSTSVAKGRIIKKEPVEGRDVLFVTGEDIRDIKIFKYDENGHTEKISYTPGRESGTIGELLYILSKERYKYNYGIDPDLTDTSHEYVPFDQYYSLVCKKYAEFSALGVPAGDMSQRRWDFNDLDSLFYYAAGQSFATKEITIPQNEKTEVEIISRLYGPTVEIISGWAADFEIDKLDVTFIPYEATELNWVKSNMGLEKTGDTYTATLDPETPTPWEPVYILMYGTSIMQ